MDNETNFHIVNVNVFGKSFLQNYSKNLNIEKMLMLSVAFSSLYF